MKQFGQKENSEIIKPGSFFRLQFTPASCHILSFTSASALLGSQDSVESV
jgi:hypothetical protein